MRARGGGRGGGAHSLDVWFGYNGDPFIAPVAPSLAVKRAAEMIAAGRSHQHHRSLITRIEEFPEGSRVTYHLGQRSLKKRKKVGRFGEAGELN
jgi:hypothetical protein